MCLPCIYPWCHAHEKMYQALPLLSRESLGTRLKLSYNMYMNCQLPIPVLYSSLIKAKQAQSEHHHQHMPIRAELPYSTRMLARTTSTLWSWPNLWNMFARYLYYSVNNIHKIIVLWTVNFQFCFWIALRYKAKDASTSWATQHMPSLTRPTHFHKRREGSGELRTQAMSHWNAISWMTTRFQIMHSWITCSGVKPAPREV